MDWFRRPPPPGLQETKIPEITEVRGGEATSHRGMFRFGVDCLLHPLASGWLRQLSESKRPLPCSLTTMIAKREKWEHIRCGVKRGENGDVFLALVT